LNDEISDHSHPWQEKVGHHSSLAAKQEQCRKFGVNKIKLNVA
jgi:hypothetical protein